ncbi:MAG: hypothetical protein GX751_03130 [Desulfuromonadaceae bacterium]|nr:hypothetical protein [Desulfuromonadaceae bacterium]
MKTIYTVLFYAGFIISAFIFFSSLFVTIMSRYRLEKKLSVNRAWLTPGWLAILFLGFGTPYFFFGVLLWNRAEQNMVLITTATALVLGFLLGKKVEEELRDYGKPQGGGRGGGARKKKPRRR